MFYIFNVIKGRMCAPFWTMYGGDHCFEILYQKLSHSAAESHCVSSGGHLASFHTKEELEFMRKLASDNNIEEFWVGFFTKKEREYFWTDGSKVDFIHSNSINLATENACYRYKRQNNEFKGRNCADLLRFMCKMKPKGKSMRISTLILENENFYIDIRE